MLYIKRENNCHGRHHKCGVPYILCNKHLNNIHKVYVFILCHTDYGRKQNETTAESCACRNKVTQCNCCKVSKFLLIFYIEEVLFLYQKSIKGIKFNLVLCFKHCSKQG